MDFRLIRLDDVGFDRLTQGRCGIRYGANTKITFQVPRTTFNMVSGRIPGSMSIVPVSLNIPAPFLQFMDTLVEKACVTNTRPLERLSISDDTLFFDIDGNSTDTPVQGTVVDASLIVSVTGAWSNGVSSGLCIDVDQVKMYDCTLKKVEPRVFIDGKCI